jgi:uncharacterized protein YjbI with pentapeptide repeats
MTVLFLVFGIVILLAVAVLFATGNMQRTWARVRVWAEDTATENPVRLSLYLFMAFFVIVFGTSLWYWVHDFNGFAQNVLAEAHGLLFDLLVIGVLLLALNRKGEQKLNIRRYKEEIEDYLGWQADEAKYRIVGNIKRLNRQGISDINLKAAYLRGVKLRNSNLVGADLRGADLRGADLVGVNLEGANLRAADLSGADLFGASLQEADLSGANLQATDLPGANLWRANLSRTRLTGADLFGANLQEANLNGARLNDVKLPGANLSGANLAAASLDGIQYNEGTLWPEAFVPPPLVEALDVLDE